MKIPSAFTTPTASIARSLRTALTEWEGENPDETSSVYRAAASSASEWNSSPSPTGRDACRCTNTAAVAVIRPNKAEIKIPAIHALLGRRAANACAITMTTGFGALGAKSSNTIKLPTRNQRNRHTAWIGVGWFGGIPWLVGSPLHLVAVSELDAVLYEIDQPEESIPIANLEVAYDVLQQFLTM